MSGIVFVSGASRGLGAALARHAPPAVRVLDLSRSGGEYGRPCEHVAVDLASEPGWRQAAECFDRELARRAGERAVFFHNAGTLDPIGYAGEVDSDAYTRNVLLNAAAPPILGSAFLAAAAKHGCRAELVLVSSGAADKVYEGWSAYCAGKAAVEHWVRTVGAEQVRRGGARVLSVRPGVVDTQMQTEIRATDARDFPEVARFVDRHAAGSLRAADDVARALWALLERDVPSGSVLGETDLPAPA